MSLENFIYSKHFVYKQSLFSTSKKLLTLKFSGLSLDSLPYTPSSYETIDFSEITKLEVPDRNDKDLILNYKKKGQALTFEFSSYNRANFLIEFYKAHDLYKCSKKTYKDLFEIVGFQVFCEKETEDVRLELTRTCLRLHYLRKAQEDSLLKEFLDITLPKNSESSLRKSHEIIDYLINLTQIKAIFRGENGFFMMLNFSEIVLSFQFSEEQMKRVDFFLEDLRSNNEDYCKGFPLIEFSDKPLELKLSYKTLQSFIMKEKAYKISMSKAKKELIYLAFNDEAFFEIGADSQNLINKMPLISILAITRQDFPENTGFSLIFSDKSIEEYLINGYTRDLIISNLQYLISHKKTDILSIEHLQTKGSWESRRELKIEGFLNNDPDPDYELDVMKRILTPKREENFNEILKEFTLNLTLKKFDFIDNKVLVFLIEKFLSFLNVFNNSDFLEMTDILMRHSMGQHLDLSDKLSRNPEFLKKSDENMKKLDNLKRFLPLKVNNLTIELSNYPQICYYLEEILKALTILITNRGFFREFALNKKEVLYEKFLIQLITLFRSPHPVLGYLSFNFLKCLSNHPDQKSECLNKYYIFNTQSFDFFTNFTNFFLEKLFKNTLTSLDNLPVISSLKLAKSWIKDRKESTQQEDLERIFKVLTTKETLILMINTLNIENLEAFSKISQILLYIFDAKPGLKIQKSLFENSVFFLIYFRAAVLFKIPHLKTLSMAVLSKSLFENGDACSLLVRLVPKNMISLVKTSQTDLSKWSGDLWEQFFEVLSKDYSNASEFWDVFSRNELMEKVEVVEKAFLKRFREIVAGGLRTFERSSVLLDNQGSTEGKRETMRTALMGDFPQDRDFLDILKFNHQDFYIEYTSLRSCCLVGRYHLTYLLKQDSSEPPKLSMNITHVYRFWTELNFAFLSRESFEEKSLILKIMILVSRNYFREIKEFSSMGYFLNLLLEKNQDYLYLVLQLLYISLTREDSRANIRLFLQFDGVDKLFLLLARIICNNDDREEFEEWDYTDGKFAQKVCRKLSEKRNNACLFVLEIIKALLSSEKPEDFSMEDDEEDGNCQKIEENPKTIELCPAKSLKDYLRNQIYIEILCNCFLSEDTKIWLSVLEILRKDLISRDLLPYFLNFKGFFDLLMLRFNKFTFLPILDIVLLLKKLVLEISRNSSQINYFRFYSHFTFDELAEATVKKAIDYFSFMKFFPKSLLNRLFSGKVTDFLSIFESESYEVPDLIWTREMRSFLENMLFSETLRHRKNLIEYSQTWHLEMKPLEKSKGENFIDDRYIEKSDRGSQMNTLYDNYNNTSIVKSPMKLKLEGIPKYETDIEMPIRYAILEREVMCGPLFLRVWNRPEFKTFEIESQNVEKFLRLLEQKMAFLMQEIKEKPSGFINFEEELYQLLLALSKALKRYKIANYSNFEETFEIIRQFSTNTKVDGLRFRLVGMRAIYRAISLENSGNLDSFLRKKGLLVIFEVFKLELERIYAKIQESKLFLIEPATIKLLAKIISIFLLIIERQKEDFIGLDPQILKSFFSILQQISLIILRFLDVKTSNKMQLDWFFSGGQNPLFSSLFTKVFFPVFSRFLLLISLESSLSGYLIESGLGLFSLRICLIKENLENSSEFIEFIESMALLLKNLTIWAYESYILSNNSGSKKLEISSSGNSRKTSRIFLNIHKLSKREKDLLSLFYENLYSLILKENLTVLLREYQEPSIEKSPNQAEFLDFFNKDCENLAFCWKIDMRTDLRDLLKDSIEEKVMKNEEFKEKDLSELREYKFATYLNELIIEEVLIGVFNKSPETQKLPNFGYFLKLLFTNIRENWDFIEENRVYNKEKTNENRLKSPLAIYFRKILQGIEACAHILRLQQLDSLFLEKSHFTVLVKSLLNSQKPPQNLNKHSDSLIIEEGLNKIQRNIFFILSKLTLIKDGIMALLQNKGAIVGFVRSFRANSENLKDLLFEILKNISMQSHLFAFLPKFGFLTFFLEFSLKSEVFSIDFRQKSFEFLLWFSHEKEHNFSVIVKGFFNDFPKIIRDFIENPLNLLENIDRELESNEEFWTPRMRKEVWLALKLKNDKIQSFLEDFDCEFISLDSNVIDYSEKLKLQLKYPEIREEINIDGVFLRSFVKSPEKLDINPGFLRKLLENTDVILLKHSECLKNEEVSERSNRLLYESLLTSCSVLLVFEQILVRNQVEFKGFEAKCVGNWLELMRIKGLNGHLKSVLLEIALICEEIEVDIKGELEIVKICSFVITEQGDEMERNEEEGDHEVEGFRFIEEIILLQLLLKCMLKDRKTLSLVYSNIMPILLKFLEQGENKSYLDPIIMCILALLIKDLEFAESSTELLSKKAYINVEKDFEKIKPRDYDFKCLWRGFNEKCDFSSHLEKTFGHYGIENSVMDFSLPVISELILNQLPIFNEEVKKELMEVEEFVLKEVYDSQQNQ